MFTCGFAGTVNDARWLDDRTYKDIMWQRDILIDAFKTEFPNKALDNMTYHDAYIFSDVVESGIFEGIP